MSIRRGLVAGVGVVTILCGMLFGSAHATSYGSGKTKQPLRPEFGVAKGQQRNNRIVVVGSGAVGLGLASYLIESGRHVDILSRGTAADSLRKHGLTRTGIFGKTHFTENSFSVITDLKSVKRPPPYDHVLVCVKSYHSDEVAQQIAPLFDPKREKPKVVLFQNGWGNAEIFAKHIPEKLIYNAVLVTGYEKTNDHTVKITADAAPTRIGSQFGGATSDIEPLCEALSRNRSVNGTKTGINVESSNDINRVIWSKMLLNCSVNALSAIENMSIGRLVETSHTRRKIDSIVREIFQVMKAEGIRTEWQTAENCLTHFYKHIAPSVKDHMSSMHQDKQLGRRCTEIDVLNGAVLKLAKKHGIETPVNAEVCQAIEQLTVRPPQQAAAQ